MKSASVFLSVSLLSLLSACGKHVPPPTMDELKNATFNELDRGTVSVTLENGAWTTDSSTKRDGSKQHVVLEKDFLLKTDLDSNGVHEAVVLLTETFGGSESFTYMAITHKEGDKPVNQSTELLGDRIQVRNVRVNGGLLQLDYLEQAPFDPMCCPGQLVTRTWKLAPKGLTLESIRSPGRLDLEIISEDEWELERWDMHESVGKGPTVTLTFQDGRFVGSAGCNRYFAPITVGQIPGDITIGPIGGTRMACADTAMMVETRFLQQLAGVTRVGFLNTRLTLTVPRDSVSSTTMLFRRKGKNE